MNGDDMVINDDDDVVIIWDIASGNDSQSYGKRPLKSRIFPWKRVIFHGYVSHYPRVAWDPFLLGHMSCPWTVAHTWPCCDTSCNHFLHDLYWSRLISLMFCLVVGRWLLLHAPACSLTPLKSCQGSVSECDGSLAGKAFDRNTKKPDELPSRTYYCSKWPESSNSSATDKPFV